MTPQPLQQSNNDDEMTAIYKTLGRFEIFCVRVSGVNICFG